MVGGGGGRTLEETPTWAVACVCFVLLAISMVIEHALHLLGKWLKKKDKKALYESLEKIKAELMLLGFISLLLTVATESITGICISKSAAATWHPCSKKEEKVKDKYDSDDHHRKLMSFTELDGSFRKFLATAPGDNKCEEKNKVAFISADGIHQLHLFIFVLALFHVVYCIFTLVLGRAKMRTWKAWEKESRSAEYQFSHDPERFRFARETSFGRRHLSFWTNNSVLIWIVCFFRQFVVSVPKVDYLTLRHGFITAHLSPQSHENFDFRKYIKRSLEEDFKVVVGISPPIWFAAVLFILFQTHGTFSYFWLPFIPLIITLLVGTKLQVIITKMGLRIQERCEVVQGVPVVKPGDDLFWFNHPRLILYLINYVLFQNAFQLAYFAWTWYEFGLKSCFNEKTEDFVIRITMGVLTQILCSYITFPLHALVAQMGSTMKPTIFNDRVAVTLKSWHRTAKKNVKKSHHHSRSTDNTPFSSQPGTPSRNNSPIHLLRHHRSSDTPDSLQALPRGEINVSSFETRGVEPERWDEVDMYLSTHDHRIELGSMGEAGPSQVASLPEITRVDQQTLPKDFSFRHKTNV